MCGIAGFCLHPDSAKELPMKDIAKELLLGIEPRGHDATGMAWFGQGGGMVVDKSPMPASRFTHIIQMGANTSTAVLHTRLATTGKPENNLNNHPIVSTGKRGTRVVLTHNGWVTNYSTLFKTHELGRRAEVDTEVIASFLHKYGDDYDKLGDAIDGNYALGYLREDQPGTLYLVRGHSSPLVLMQTKWGVFYASTEFALAGIQQYVGGPLIGWQGVAEGRSVKVVDGEIVSTSSFDMQDTWSKYTGNQVRTSHTRWDTDDWYDLQSTRTVQGRQRTNYTVDQSGVVHLPGTTGSEDTGVTGPRTYNMWTDTKRGRRVYVGDAAKERKEFFGIGEAQGSDVPSAYGRYVNIAKRGDCIEFWPWPVDGDTMTVEEAVLEDLLFTTADQDDKDLPASIKYEMHVLKDKLNRKGTGQTGVLMGASYTTEEGVLFDGDGQVVPKDSVPAYLRVQGVWYFKQSKVEGAGYKLEVSAFQRDSDHINPRGVTPPAGKTASGEEDTDFALIHGRVWAQDDDTGMWGPTDTKVDELTAEELLALGYEGLTPGDDDALRVIEQAIERAEATKGTKVG